MYGPLNNKTVILGITGGIAAYKVAGYIRPIKDLGCDVIPVMTQGAMHFITPLTVSALSGNKVKSCLLAEQDHEITHINLARKADLILIAPATANFIANAAMGMAPDLLSAILLATTAPVLICPAMNPSMYKHPSTQHNIELLKKWGYHIIEPMSGSTACGEAGAGRLAEWDTVKEALLKTVTPQDLAGKKVLITAGPTREPIDPIRYISNRSSGKMGIAMARIAKRRGADVHLVTGPVSVPLPDGVSIYRIETAKDMLDTVLNILDDVDIIIMTAAVADFTPEHTSSSKIKKQAITGNKTLSLTKTGDILVEISKRKKTSQLIIGFCAETKKLEEYALEKLERKSLDLIVANNITRPGSGFDVDTNEVLLIDKDKNKESIPLSPKIQVAEKIWDKITTLL